MALDLKDYTKTEWAPEMPITQERMENLENGVYDNREALQSLDNNVDSNTASIDGITNGIGNNSVSDYSGKTLWDAIATLYSTISAATAGSTAGTDAWTQIVNLIGKDSLGN